MIKVSLEDIRNKAREKLKGVCGVYKICDGDLMGRICQGQSYGRPIGIGGIGSGASFANNTKSLAKIRLKMRLIGPHFEPNTKMTLFGKPISMPILGGSVSGVNSFGGETVITEGDFCRAVVLGCKEAGTIGFRGDTYTYSLDETPGLDAIKDVGGWGVKISKPREQSVMIEFFKKAEQIGCIAVGTDIEGCGSSIMAKYNKPVFRKSVEDLRELVSCTSLPFIVKGIMTVEDAEAAIDAGASAIVVSNHGGRVLDHTPGMAEVLPEIVAAVKGKGEVTILADGGVRTGFDVLKILALGAEAVLIGRDIVRAAIGAGSDGVRIHLEYLNKILKRAMLMTDCPTLKEITPDILC
jgi:isopentenyl diphosphate isomerase/L-lactate dehydrogenase-like FMN-dependent dehydrogenase